MKRRNWAAVAAGLAVALLGGYTAFWFIGAGEIRDRMNEWVAGQRAKGYEVSYTESDVSGFPLRFETRIVQPRVTSVLDGWHWSGDSLRLWARPWNFHAVDFDLAGRHDVSLFTEAGWFDFTCLIEGASGAFVLGADGDVREFAVEVTNLDYSRPDTGSGGGVGYLWATGDLPVIGSTDYTTPSANLSIVFDNLILPAETSWVLHRHPMSLTLEATMTGPLPSRGEPADSLAVWRDAGGVVQISQLDMRWGPIGLSSNGTLALDSQMRPLGAFTADIIGHGDVIDLLAANKFVPLGDATFYKLGFDLLARSREEGGPPVLTVPITVQDGDLRLGPIKIDEVSPIVPPDASITFGNTS